MGGLVCSLLLVIAVGCTCRLYALRLGINRSENTRSSSSLHHTIQGAISQRIHSLAPLTRLQHHLLQREPPPSYNVAVNDPSAL